MRTLALVFTLILTGCATHATLNVYTDPIGARITQIDGGQHAGVSPTWIKYDPSWLRPHQDVNGCYRVKGVRAEWQSGASAQSAPVLTLCESITGTYHITLYRPPSAPDLETDLAFAQNVQQHLDAQKAKEQNDNLAGLLMLGILTAAAANPSSTGNVPPLYPNPNNDALGPGDSILEAKSGCSSDLACGTGYRCVKPPMEYSGVCMQVVDDMGMPTLDLPDSDTLGPGEASCHYDTECPVGFRCDRTLKACVK